MAEYMHLVGAEDVRSAANTMTRAADQMQSAARQIDDAMERQERFFLGTVVPYVETWIARLEAAAKSEAA